MRRLVVGLGLFTACLPSLRASDVLRRAQQNEISAVSEASGRRVALRGRITALSFEAVSVTELEATTTPSATTPATTTRMRAKTSGYETPYADVELEQLTVRCYFETAAVASPLAVGQAVALVGEFHALRRDAGAWRLWLRSCEPQRN
jgi:hypothetical protein